MIPYIIQNTRDMKLEMGILGIKRYKLVKVGWAKTRERILNENKVCINIIVKHFSLYTNYKLYKFGILSTHRGQEIGAMRGRFQVKELKVV